MALLIVCAADISGHRISYTLCRILPDTALVMRDVLREAARLWSNHLGREVYEEARNSVAGEAFFTGRIRLEEVPPEREMIGVWLPFPPDFEVNVRVQLLDFIEAFDAEKGMRAAPRGWPNWS